jgi:hypothetical protein
MHTREFSGYEPVPPDVTQKIVAEAESLKAEGGR